MSKFRVHFQALFLVLVALLSIVMMEREAGAQGSRLDPEMMLDIQDFGSAVEFSATGDWAAYVLPDRTDEWNILAQRPRGYVYLQSLKSGGEAAKALTEGRERSSFPVWSPSGKELAFISQGPEGIYLKVWHAETSEITRFEPALPAAPYLAPLWVMGETAIVLAPEVIAETPQETQRFQVMRSSDQTLPGDEFFSNLRQARLWKISTRGERFRELYSSPIFLRSWSLAPDERGLVYTVAVNPGKPSSSQLSLLLDLSNVVIPRPIGNFRGGVRWTSESGLLVRLDGEFQAFRSGGTEPLVEEELPFNISSVYWGSQPDLFLSLLEDPSQSDPEIEPVQPGMFTIARPFMDLYMVWKKGEYRNLTEDLSDQVSDPVWQPDGEGLYFRTIDNQTYDEALWHYDVATESRTRLLEGAYSFSNLAALPNGLAFTRESATQPRDLWVLESGNSSPRRLTNLNPQLDDIEFSAPELFQFQSSVGDTLGALLYKPAGYQPGRQVPVITYVYEKLTPQKNRFSERNQLFLQQGYAVLMPNVKVKVGETGDSFVRSVVPAVEAVREMGISNGKFALWGGSFGAYATSYVITQTNIFACAVSRATPPELFRNWASGRDRDSNNIEKGQARMGGSPFEVQDRYLSQSAFFHLDQVETPVLLLHGKQDRTILYEEGAMMFYALRRLGKEAVFVGYEHGDHSLYRHSRVDALDVHSRMLAWFEKYLRNGDSEQ